MAKKPAPQLGLFPAQTMSRAHAPAHPARLTRLAAALPPRVSLGTSSWSFPGWRGLVYDGQPDERVLAQDGLCAYRAHPLLNAVGVDRSFYAPVDESVFATYRDQAGPGFSFLVKMGQQVTRRRLMDGRDNPDFLDERCAQELWVEPITRGLGDALNVVLLQFSPEATSAAERALVCRRLDRFLAHFERRVPFAIEVRNPEWLHEELAQVLQSHGVLFCLNAIAKMPPIAVQAERMGVLDQERLVVRWMLTADMTYQGAREAFAPFDQLLRPDPATRDAIAHFVWRFAGLERSSLVIVNNKAEGCAPLSIAALAALLAER